MARAREHRAPHTGATTATTSTSSGSPPPAPAPKTETAEEVDEARYSRIKEKLETLGRLKTEGVLTDEQYEEQFAKIMSEL